MSPDPESQETWQFGLVQWDGRAYEVLRSIHKADVPKCLHRAVAPEFAKLRDAAIYLELLNGIKYSVARVDGTIRADMTIHKVDLVEYVELMSRIHVATGRTRYPSYPVFVQECLIRSRKP
jgi:hypothetical protein